MEFEDILKDVGDFGYYQKFLLIVFVLPCYIVIPWYSMDLVFMTSTPEHWCFVPEVDNSNLSLEMQKHLIRPPQDESCSMYDVNYTEIMLTGNFTVDPLWPTTRCTHGWKFDTKDYDATAVTSWNLVCKNAYLSSLVLSMVFVGTVFGTPIYGWMLDKIGRKPSFFFLSTLVAVAEISSVFSPFFVLFLVLRAIQGSVMSSVYSSGYVILLELVSPKLRSWINGLVTTAWSIGLCLLPLIAYLTRDWVRHSMVTASCAAAIWIYWKLLPESPRWLILAGRFDEANAILCKISKYNGKSAHNSTKLKQKIEGDFGTFIPFLIFAIISCLSGICSSFLPETLNKNLPQTVEDAENFETNFSYLSCFSHKESTTDDEKTIKKDINKNISELSAADLQISLKGLTDYI